LGRGSYVLTFAGYNAGRGSVKKWIERYGDPRDPKVDAVDWVEQIPFSETRNYVQRIMENLQVYRARRDQAPDRSRPASRRRRPIAAVPTTRRPAERFAPCDVTPRRSHQVRFAANTIA
jgi:hypothetical protein